MRILAFWCIILYDIDYMLDKHILQPSASWRKIFIAPPAPGLAGMSSIGIAIRQN